MSENPRARPAIVARIVARYLTRKVGIPLSTRNNVIEGVPGVDVVAKSWRLEIHRSLTSVRQPPDVPRWVFIGGKEASSSWENIVVVMNIRDFVPLFSAWYEAHGRKG